MPSIELIKASDGSGNANVATIQSSRSIGATTLDVDTVAGINNAGFVGSMGTPHTFTDPVTSETITVISEATCVDFSGHVDGSNLEIDDIAPGYTDLGSEIGDIVIIRPTTQYADNLADVIDVSHADDGTIHATRPKIVTSIDDANGNEVIKTPATSSAVNEITVTNAAAGSNPSISASGGDSAIHLNLQGKGLAKTVTIGVGGAVIFPYDYVVSGCVITADAAGSTKNWSMTAGVVVINGNPITVAAVTASVATASKDTYVDVLDAGNGTGTVVITGGNIVNNNAASPALASNSIRVGIIVCGASNIASAASINQGQEDKVLPIASSIPYAVTDSLGNRICPRDPNRKLLGYRQILSGFTLSSSQTTPTQITGLSCPVIIPTGRKVLVRAYCGQLSAAGGQGLLTIWSGVVNSGTKLNQGNSSGTAAQAVVTEALLTPSSASTTFNAGIANSGSNNTTVGAASTTPSYIIVELA